MKELTQNIWARYGFRDNPYDTKALSITNNLPITKAYIEREDSPDARRIMNYYLHQTEGGNIIVEGDSGVGKTTFVNYYKYLYNTARDIDKLFSPETEISVQKTWGIEDFILSALGSLVGQLRMEIGEKKIRRKQFIKEIMSLTSVLFQSGGGISASVLGSGGSLSKSPSVTVGRVTETSLTEYLRRLVDYIKTLSYRGVVLHFNNMELLQKENKKQLMDLFENLRDVLQTPGIYFIFVGGKSFYRNVILPLDRVRSIFYDEPVVIVPFTQDEVGKIVEKRYEILGEGRAWIKPVDVRVIQYLHSSFNGRIRDLMNSVTNLMSRIPEGYTNTLALEDAKDILQKIEINKLINQGLSDTDIEVLRIIIRENYFSNSSLVAITSKSKQHINKFLQKFIELDLIIQSEKKGRSTIYKVHQRLELLSNLMKT